MIREPNLLAVAVQYVVENHWLPIPIPLREKRPTVAAWNDLRLDTREKLAEHFNGQPQNIGILLGEASGGLTDVDLDYPECLPFARLFLPVTRQFGRTTNPVSHWLYTVQDAPQRAIFMSGADMVLEIRGNRHQTVFPPSTHKETGEQILWVGHQPLHAIAYAELHALCAKVAAGAVLSRVWPREKGSRHFCALALAGVLLRAGFSVALAKALIGTIARLAGNEAEIHGKVVDTTKQRLDAGGTTTGWKRLRDLLDAGKAVDSVPAWLGYPKHAVEAELEIQEEREAIEAEPILMRLSDVAPEEVRWLWPGRIARRKSGLIIGDPGIGKSSVTLDIGSRITVGGLWPDGGRAPVGNVILLTCEDGLADTIRPRIDALGGDPARFYALQGIRLGDIEKPFSLATDVDMLERAIAQVGDVALVIVDPLSAYLGTKSDSYKDSDVRGVLGPLALLADKCNVSVQGVMHLNKNSQQAVLYRAPGSIAFIAAARTVFAVAKDPDDENRRILAGIKNNLGPIPPALGFQILFPSSGIAWVEEPVNVSAESLLSSPSSSEERDEQKDVDEFLRDLLSNGQVSSNDVYKATRQNGFSEPTVKRGKRRLGIEAIHIGQPGEKGQWFWSLPKGIKKPPKGIKPEEVIPFEQTKALKAINSIASPKGIKDSELTPFGDPLRKDREEDWL